MWTTFADELVRYARSWGLTDDAAWLYATLMVLRAYYQGAQPLPILSGARDRAWTRQAQARWDQGDRQGLAVRPASDSRHHTGDAFDLAGGDAETLRWLGQIAVYYGMRWGGSWTPADPRHYDTG